MFGPHETNLAWGREFSDRHAAYYASRAAGGTGMIVFEEASVHPSDWPYERCPAADQAADGWTRAAHACRDVGDGLVLAALGHAGGQGSSAFHQRELWAPSDEPEVNSREVPKIMELEDIVAVVSGFFTSAKVAAEAGLDGVEINAGQHSLIRQYLSGLTNHRSDAYGEDRERFLREVLTAARAGLGPESVLGLRLSCDELAPWAGITPEIAQDIVCSIAPMVDYITVVRGGIFSLAETRPTLHHDPGFNAELSRGIRDALQSAGFSTPVIAQGSIVDVSMAEDLVATRAADGVEMTRAQLADPDLVAKAGAGQQNRIRPCVLCNQWCKVRDNRNPIISCVVNPRTGYEADPDPEEVLPALDDPRQVLVVGAGPAGLEAARVAALRGQEVRLVDQNDEPGGMLAVFSTTYAQRRFKLFADWLIDECLANGVSIYTGGQISANHLAAWQGDIVLATGSRPAPPTYELRGDMLAFTAAEALNDLDALPEGDIAIWDPIGGQTGVALAEALADREGTVSLITPDGVAGTLLSLSGDLAGSNVRLQQKGLNIIRRHNLLHVNAKSLELEHVNTGQRMQLATNILIDASARYPKDALWEDRTNRTTRIGDAVAARTVGDAVREGRLAAFALDGPHGIEPTDSPDEATG